MATSLLILIDDIATILDDVAVMSKAAAKKTAGVLADDLALNAEQVSGVKANRELPVVWAVAKGSFLNKAILVPAALLISAFVPWAITPLLMMGGAYLCYEGFEKVSHRLLHSKAEVDAHHAEELKAVADPRVNLVQFEKRKIKGAIRTDFILSAEIIVITLGVVASAGFIKQVVVLSFMAIAITVFVYGLVAGILMLDDAGLYLFRQRGAGRWRSLQRRMGAWILRAAPWLMKGLSFAGTAAMFLVGGGILVHGLPFAHALLHHWTEGMRGLSGIFSAMLLNGVAGIIAGALVLSMVLLSQRTLRSFKAS